MVDWQPNSAIKPDGQVNTIKVRTRVDGKIEISVNGSAVTSITPENGYPTAGSLGLDAGVDYDDVHDTNPRKY